jgi:hypothetical protein
MYVWMDGWMPEQYSWIVGWLFSKLHTILFSNGHSVCVFV